MKKRLLSMLLCVAMCLSVMHVPAYAEESTENEPEKTIAEETTSFVDEALEEDFQQINQPEEAPFQVQSSENNTADIETSFEESMESEESQSNDYSAEEASSEDSQFEINSSSDDYPTIELNVEITAVISNGGDLAFFRFMPNETGNYRFYSISDEDTYGYLYDEKMNLLTENDDGGNGGNFRIDYSLQKDTVYIVAVKFLSSEITGSIPLMVAAVPEILSVSAINKTIYEGSNGYYAIAENGEAWFCYDCPQPEGITLSMSDGNVYSGTIESVINELGETYELWLGYNCSFSVSQNYENQFSGGKTYSAELTIGPMTVQYEILIKETPIISINAADITIYEGTHCEREYHGDTFWFEYFNIAPSDIEVKTAEKTYSGPIYDISNELYEDYHVRFDYNYQYVVEQSYSNQFELGKTYKSVLSFAGMTFAYGVTIIGFPIESIEAEGINILEGTHCRIITDGNKKWLKYDCIEPESVTVKTSDGKIYKGSLYSVCQEMNEKYDAEPVFKYNYKDTQSYEKQFIAGDTYEVLLTCSGKSAVYGISIEPQMSSGSCGENLTWSFDDVTGTLTVTGTGEMSLSSESSGVIPWYKYKEQIKNIVIHEGTTSIFGFSDCHNLQTISLPDSLTVIENGTFANCSSLESITLPAGIRHLGRELNASRNDGGFCGTFFGCYNLKDIYYLGTEEQWKAIEVTEEVIGNELSYPDETHSLGELEDVGIYVIYHPSQTVLHCQDITRKYENKGFCYRENWRQFGGAVITSPGDYWNKNLIVPSEIDGLSVTGISYSAFNGQDYEKVVIPSSIQEVGFLAFSGCSKLTEVIYENGADPGGNSHDAPFSAAQLHKMIVRGSGAVTIDGWCRIDQLFLPSDLKSFTANIYLNSFSIISLESIYYAGTAGDWNDQVDVPINIDSSTTTLHFLQNLEVTKLPDKLHYRIGEALDLTGGTLLFTYDDGTQESFPMENYMISGFNNTEPGTQTLTVNVGAFAVAYDVTVENVRELKVESADGRWTYDGTTHSNQTYTVIYGEDIIVGTEGRTQFTLSTGDKLTITPTSSAKVAHVSEGDVDNVFTWTVENEDYYVRGADQFGKLRVMPADLSIYTDSAEQVYDGTALTADGTVWFDGTETALIHGENTSVALAGTDTITIKITGIQTEAGTSRNTCEINWNNAASTDYKVWKYIGELTVTEAHSCGDNLSWEFDDATNTLTITGEGTLDVKRNHVPWAVYIDQIQVVVVDQGVDSILGEGFSNHSNLQTVYLPDSITILGNNDFGDKYTSGNPVDIRNANHGFCRTFFGCYNLKSIYYAGSEEQWKATKIKSTCLYDGVDWGLITEEITLGELEADNYYVIYHPTQTTLYCSDKTRSHESRGYNYAYQGEVLGTYFNGEGDSWTEDFIIPSVIDDQQITGVGYCAFNGSDIKSIYLPKGIQSIGLYAFYGAERLREMRVESGSELSYMQMHDYINYLDKLIFEGKENLSIYQGMGSGCIKSLYIPANLSELRITGHFVQDLYYSGSETDWNRKVTISEDSDLSETTMHYLQTIKITNLPYKLNYQIGESLDLTGSTLLFTYDDGTQESFFMENYMISGFDNTQAGTSILSVNVGELQESFNISIIDEGDNNPILFVEAENVILYEGAKGKYENDSQGGWFYYTQYSPEFISVTTRSGVYSGTPDKVCQDLNNMYGEQFYYEYQLAESQGKDNELKPGETYNAVFIINGKETVYQVTIKPSPIVSIKADDTKVCEYTNGAYIESGSEKWYRYYGVTPQYISVVTNDGETYSGSVDTVCFALEKKYNTWWSYTYYFETEQSFEHQLTTGKTYDEIFVLGTSKARLSVTIIPNPITSIEAADGTVFEGTNGYENETDGVKWFYYSCINPENITVKTNDGRSYSGSEWWVAEQIQDKYGITVDYYCNYVIEQDYNNKFTVGHSYDAVLHFLGKQAEYKVSIVKNPIASVQAYDVTIYEKNYGYYQQEKDRAEWFYYSNVEPEKIVVVTTDGDIYSGEVYQVLNELRDVYGESLNCDYYFSDYQSSDHQFDVGQYAAELNLLGKRASYTVTILAAPFREISATDTSVFEWNYGEYRENDGQEWFYYYETEPDTVSVTTIDGKEYSGSLSEVSNALYDVYGYWFYFHYHYIEEQSYSNQLKKDNTYEAFITLCGKEAVYNVSIKENPIASVEASDVTIYEDCNGWIERESDGEEWFYYSAVPPKQLTVKTKDGAVLSGTYDEVCSKLQLKYGEWLHSFNEYVEKQSFNHQFTAGKTYDAVMTICGKRVNYKVTIVENPIVSVKAYSRSIYANNRGFFVREDDGEEWYYYSALEPERISVTTGDGEVYSGDLYQVLNDLNSKYAFWSEQYDYNYYFVESQSIDHQFTAGHTYKAEFVMMGKIATYSVTILANPIWMVSATDATTFENGFGRYREDSGVEWFYYYGIEPETVTVTAMDGEVYSGSFDDVNSDLYDAYGEWFDFYYHFTSDQSYLNQFKIGYTYESVVELCGKKAEYNVSIAENPIISIEAYDTTIYEGDYGWLTQDEDGNEWFCYSCPEPDQMTVRTSDGESFSGSSYTVYQNLYDKYGKHINYYSSFVDEQSFENQFSVGNTYEALLTFGGRRAVYEVNIKPAPVILDRYSLKITVNSSETLTASTYYGNPVAVTWSSSDANIASVDSNGRVTANAVGKAVITASNGHSSASCEVSVLFTDVTSGYYYNPVYWAAENGITKGYGDGSFGVGRNCQRRELMIFLWRYAGKPIKDKYGNAYGDARRLFNDLSSYGATTDTNKAIAWAYKEGIVKGYSDGGFHPTASIVRKDVMIMLYRYAGKPSVSGTLTFTDCTKLNKNSDTYRSILWGSQKGITKGYSSGEYAGQFGTNLNCLREQIVTFLYRFNNLKN